MEEVIALLNSSVVLRAFLLCVLPALLFVAPSRADSAPALPSRKANVVIPLLAKLSPNDYSRKAVIEAIARILGNCDSDEKGSRGREYLEYWLDDKNKVMAVFKDGQFVMLAAPTQSEPDRIIYPLGQN